jgi:hypothetical protein
MVDSLSGAACWPNMEASGAGRAAHRLQAAHDCKEAPMHRIIVANRRGHQVVEWETTDTEEARASIAEAERILREARERGCAVSRKVGDQHILDNRPFDPSVQEYQIIAPIAGG